MWNIELVGTVKFSLETKEAAITKLAELEEKGPSYGNRFIRGPKGEVINVWDIR